MPVFLTSRTKQQQDLNKSSEPYQKSKLFQSFSACELAVTKGNFEENKEPFLAAQFDLLAELETGLIDSLT